MNNFFHITINLRLPLFFTTDSECPFFIANGTFVRNVPFIINIFWYFICFCINFTITTSIWSCLRFNVWSYNPLNTCYYESLELTLLFICFFLFCKINGLLPLNENQKGKKLKFIKKKFWLYQKVNNAFTKSNKKSSFAFFYFSTKILSNEKERIRSFVFFLVKCY